MYCENLKHTYKHNMHGGISPIEQIIIHATTTIPVSKKKESNHPSRLYPLKVTYHQWPMPPSHDPTAPVVTAQIILLSHFQSLTAYR